MNITEYNQQILAEWNAARMEHYKLLGLKCPECHSHDLKAQKRLVGEETILVGVCQECRNSELVIQLEKKFKDDCIYRGRLKLAEKR